MSGSPAKGASPVANSRAAIPILNYKHEKNKCKMTIWLTQSFYMYVSNVLTLNLLLIITDDFFNT